VTLPVPENRRTHTVRAHCVPTRRIRHLVCIVLCTCVAGSTGQPQAEEADSPMPRLLCGVNVEIDAPELVQLAIARTALHTATRVCSKTPGTICETPSADLAVWSTFHLRQDIRGFCMQDEKICDVRRIDPITKKLKCIIWVNVNSGVALFWRLQERSITVVPPLPPEDRPTLRVSVLRAPAEKVATAEDMVTAIRALYPHRYLDGSGRTRERRPTWVTRIKLVPEQIAGFADEGDRVWEATYYTWSGHMTLLWVHAQTGKLYFLTKPWHRDGQVKITRPFTYENTRRAVLNVAEATDGNAEIVSMFVDHVMHNQSRGTPLPTEGIGGRYVFELGFDVPGVGRQGEHIWECEHCGIFFYTKDFIWVNPRTGKTLFLCDLFKEALSVDKK